MRMIEALIVLAGVVLGVGVGLRSIWPDPEAPSIEVTPASQVSEEVLGTDG